MSTKYYEVEGIGKVSLTRRKGSKRISMRVKSDGLVSVNYPWYATQQEAFSFILSNTKWIQKQKTKIENRTVSYAIGQTISIRDYIIRIIAAEKGKLQAVKNGQEILITVPPFEDVSSERVQLFITKITVEVCRLQAKDYLPRRVRELAQQHGFLYQKVFVKNLKSKWGSCSSQKNINLNVHLMRLPDHLIDYIILHELTHTREMNHGPEFWKVLDEVTRGKARALNNAMKAESMLIKL